MSDRVAITVSSHIAHMTLTRADKMNALDPAMFEAICDAIDQLSAMPDLRAVVVSGELRSPRMKRAPAAKTKAKLSGPITFVTGNAKKLAEVQRMEAAEKRRNDEKERRLAQEQENRERKYQLMKKVCSIRFAV